MVIRKNARGRRASHDLVTDPLWGRPYFTPYIMRYATGKKLVERNPKRVVALKMSPANFFLDMLIVHYSLVDEW